MKELKNSAEMLRANERIEKFRKMLRANERIENFRRNAAGRIF